METSDWFEEDKRVYNLLWYSSPAAMENMLYLLLEARLEQPHKTNLIVVPRLMISFSRKHIVKEADLLFTIPVGIPFWGLGGHKPLIVAFFVPIVTGKEWRGPSNVRGSALAEGTVRTLDREYRKDLEGLRPTLTGRNLK